MFSLADHATHPYMHSLIVSSALMRVLIHMCVLKETGHALVNVLLNMNYYLNPCVS